jgi:predicted AAA+ superfamily ATPase
MSGSLLETYVFSEVIKSYWHNGLRPNVYYYRNSNQKEIDLVIEQDNTLYPIEFKKTATPSLSATKSFDVLNIYGKTLGEGAVICFISQITPLSSAITTIPVFEI